MKLEYKVQSNTYETINQILKNEFGLSSRLLPKLIKNQKVFLNNKITDTRNKIEINDTVTVLLDLEEDNSNIKPTKMNLNIAYEDETVLVINKPAGIAVHPSMEHFSNSLSNGVKYYFDKIGLKKKIRPVNRLDKNTSGLVVFAKNEYVQENLIQQMSNGTFKKEYLAICDGIFEKKKGTVDLPIARKENSIIERCINENGQQSITHYEVLKEFATYSLVRCTLETGRTHQIRVHMKAIGHPLLGDTMYGTDSCLISRQALHSYKISFSHPATKKHIELTCDLPEDMKKVLEA